jgi:hypothetical protein
VSIYPDPFYPWPLPEKRLQVKNYCYISAFIKKNSYTPGKRIADADQKIRYSSPKWVTKCFIAGRNITTEQSDIRPGSLLTYPSVVAVTEAPARRPLVLQF